MIRRLSGIPRVLDLPRPAFQALRVARAVALRLLGPLDAVKRLAQGRADLPPLWLRRHTGPVRNFESAAREMTALIERLGVVAPDDLVLDAGCGAGAMVPAFARLLGPRGRYVGFDMHEPSVRWCRRHFRADPRLRFESSRRGEAVRFPSAGGQAGFLLAKSLFTHLQEKEARLFLSEIRRVLRPGAAAVVTAFLFEPGEGEARAAEFFPFASPDGSARWRWKAQPESAIAFERSRFLGMIAAAGLRFEWVDKGRGFWPGAAVPRGQDALLLSHGEPRRTSTAAPNEP
jgi:SAM-dependent methyltransferase